jgi:uncharacterized protein (DUF58 family)
MKFFSLLTMENVDSFSLQTTGSVPGIGRIKIRPTPYGLGFLFLVFWVPFTGLATANNFLLIVSMMLLGLLWTSHRLAKKNVRSVSIIRKFPQEIFAERPFTVKYLVKSDFPGVGSSALRFIERPPMSSEESSISFLEAPFDKNAEYTGSYVIEFRGDRKVEPGILMSGFPFGLAIYRRICGADVSVLVFPKLQRIDSEIPPWAKGFGHAEEKIALSGITPYSFREYVPGDPYKTIDWKKTAQSGTFITRIMSDEESQFAAIRLPPAASESAISKAASLMVYFYSRRMPTVLLGPGTMLGPGSGKTFLHSVLTVLARWGNEQGEIPSVNAPGIVVDVDPEGGLYWRR